MGNLVDLKSKLHVFDSFLSSIPVDLDQMQNLSVQGLLFAEKNSIFGK